MRSLATSPRTAVPVPNAPSNPLPQPAIQSLRPSRQRQRAANGCNRHLWATHAVSNVQQKLLSEALGTALLLAVVIGSGVMAERLAGGNLAVALLANTLATVGGLYVLIEVFAPISGAHFNPAVTLVMSFRGELPKSLLLPYVAAQLAGAMLGAWLAHAMFDMSLLQFSTKLRSGTGQWIAEGVATFGLLLVILRAPPARVAAMVAGYIGAAYWFTASTSFANPAAAFGRMFSDSFAGIAPSSVPAFVVAELLGAGAAVLVDRAFKVDLRARKVDATATEILSSGDRHG
jgi:glycerol uptake facilitator-like aquaporin